MSTIYYPIVNDYGEEIDNYITYIIECPNCKEKLELAVNTDLLICPECGKLFQLDK